jgi:hypothetical protein
MKTILKVMGLQRSGTNLLYQLLFQNFDNYVCTNHIYDLDWFGWKHSKPIDRELIDLYLSRKEEQEQIIFLFTIRYYLDWEYSILNNYSYPNKSGEFLKESFKDGEDILVYTPMGFTKYKSLRDYYDTMVESYLKFYELNKDISMIINYNSIKPNNQAGTLKKIQEKFNLIRSNENYIEIKNIVTFNGEITEKLYQ